MRLSALNRKLLRDFWFLRGQALAIAAVIAGGVATWVISFSTIESLERTQQAFYADFRFAEVFADINRAPLALAERIEAIPGVRQVQTRIMGGMTLNVPEFRDPVTAQVVSLPDVGEPILNRVYLRQGALPDPNGANEVLVSEPFAEAHGLVPGDRLPAIIHGRRDTVSIAGIALSPEFIYQIRPGELYPDPQRYAILWMRERPLAAAFDMEGAFNNVALTLAPGTSIPGVIERLDRLLERYGTTGAYDRDDQLSHRFVSEEIEQLRASASVVPVIFLAVAAFLLSVVVGRIIEQQRDQVAVLKAFGYSNLAVGTHYVALVMLVVALGGIIGAGLGTWLARGLSEVYTEFFYFPDLVYVLSPWVLLSGIGVAAAAALVGTLRAVGQAVRLPPAEAMRPEPPAEYRPTLVERLGLQRLFDQPSRMVLRHLERRLLKSILSVIGIALAGAILMVGSFQPDAIDRMFEVQFELIQREDLTVTFTEPTSARALQELAAIPGVERAEPFRAVPVTLRVGHRTYRLAIEGLPPETTLRRPLDADLRPIAVPEEGLLLTDYLGELLGVGPGDWVTVEVQEGGQPVRQVPVVGLVSQYIGLSAYMELGALNRLMREGPTISGAFLAVDPARRGEVLDALQERPRVLGISQTEVAIESIEETMAETLLVFAFVTVVLAASIAFGVIYNAARVTLSEHARELASLRVLGFTRGEITYILLGELAVLVLAAIPLGFLIGYGFGYLIAAGLATDLFRVPLVIAPSTFGFSASVVLAAALFSGLLMTNRLYRLDLVSVLKTRE